MDSPWRPTPDTTAWYVSSSECLRGIINRMRRLLETCMSYITDYLNITLKDIMECITLDILVRQIVSHDRCVGGGSVYM